MQDEKPRRSNKRVWLERAVFLIAIAGMGIWITFERASGMPYTIFVDGKPVVTLESRGVAKTVLDQVRVRQSGGKSARAIRFAQRVTLRRATRGTEQSSFPEAIRMLDQMLTARAEVFAVVVDDVPVVGLADEKDAYRTLELVKQHYGRRVQNLYAEPTFKENVFVGRRYLELDKVISTLEEAVRFLTSVHEKPTYHTVQPGDRAVNLAVRYGVSLGEMKKLNPESNLDRIIEGDKLLVRKARPPVTVITKGLVKRITAVKPPKVRRRAGRAGKRQTRIVISYENGTPVSEEIISQVTTWDDAR